MAVKALVALTALVAIIIGLALPGPSIARKANPPSRTLALQGS